MLYLLSWVGVNIAFESQLQIFILELLSREHVIQNEVNMKNKLGKTVALIICLSVILMSVPLTYAGTSFRYNFKQIDLSRHIISSVFFFLPGANIVGLLNGNTTILGSLDSLRVADGDAKVSGSLDSLRVADGDNR